MCTVGLRSTFPSTSVAGTMRGVCANTMNLILSSRLATGQQPCLYHHNTSSAWLYSCVRSCWIQLLLREAYERKVTTRPTNATTSWIASRSRSRTNTRRCYSCLCRSCDRAAVQSAGSQCHMASLLNMSAISLLSSSMSPNAASHAQLLYERAQQGQHVASWHIVSWRTCTEAPFP